MLFIAGQCLQGSHSQLSITVNSFLSHTGCFALLIRSEMTWFQRSHCFLYERSAGLTNRNRECASLQCFVHKRIQVSGCTKCVLRICTCVCRCGCRWIPQNKTRTCYLSGVFVYVCMYVCVPDLHTAPCRDQWGMQRSVCSYQHTLKLSWQRTLFSDLDMKKNIGQLKAVLEFETHGPKSLHYCLSWSYRCHKISSGHLWITTLAYKLSVVSI